MLEVRLLHRLIADILNDKCVGKIRESNCGSDAERSCINIFILIAAKHDLQRIVSAKYDSEDLLVVDLLGVRLLTILKDVFALNFCPDICFLGEEVNYGRHRLLVKKS